MLKLASLLPYQMVRKQYEGEDVELLPPRMFRIGEKGPQAKVEVQFQREITTTGWILALESNSKVYTSSRIIFSSTL